MSVSFICFRNGFFQYAVQSDPTVGLLVLVLWTTALTVNLAGFVIDPTLWEDKFVTTPLVYHSSCLLCKDYSLTYWLDPTGMQCYQMLEL